LLFAAKLECRLMLFGNIRYILDKYRKTLPCACLFFISTIAADECHSRPSVASPLLETGVGITGQIAYGDPAQSQDSPITIGFNFEATDRSGNLIYNDAGTVTMSGNRFRMEVAEDLVMVSDGTTLWIYKPQSEDIIIMDAAMAGLQAASSAVSSVSSASSSSSVSAADKSLEQALHNLAALFGYAGGDASKIDIKRDPGGLMSQINFISKDNSAYTVKVKSVEPLAGNSPDSSYFTLQPRDYPNAIVTDMR